MKRLAVVLTGLLVFSLTVPGETGASEIKPVFFAGGGLSMPLIPSGFSDYWKMGFGLGGGVGMQVTSYLELAGKFFYNSFPLNEDDYLPVFDSRFPDDDLSDATLDGGVTKIMEIGVDMKYSFIVGPASPITPFVLVGVGMANISRSDMRGTVPDVVAEIVYEDATNVAISVAGGFDYMFSHQAGLWVEGRYAIVPTEGDTYGYLPVRAGVKYLLGE